MKKLVEIEYFCKLLFEAGGVPTYFINEDSVILWQFTNIKAHPLYEEPISHLGIFSTKKEFSIITSSPLAEDYFFLKIEAGVILFGPTIDKPISIEMVNGIMNDFYIPFNKKGELIDYFHSVRVMNKERLKHLGSLLYYFVNNQKLDIENVETTRSIVTPDMLISKTKQELSFHYSYLYEKRLLQLIKDGNIKGLQQTTSLLPQNGRFGTLSKKSMIRSEKNLVIAAVTLATRAALEGGVPSEEAYTVSDMYIQMLEELHEINDILHLRNDAIFDFTERVAKYKGHNYSKPILYSLKYIQKHLYEDISLGQFSELIKMNQSYVSQLFKKEVGVTLNEYILRTKIEEAQKLLSLTNYSITDIYAMLNFYDQSHFSKVFKKYSGVTPKQYRDEHLIAEID